MAERFVQLRQEFSAINDNNKNRSNQVAVQVEMILMIVEASEGLADEMIAIFKFSCDQFIDTCATRNSARRKRNLQTTPFKWIEFHA